MLTIRKEGAGGKDFHFGTGAIPEWNWFEGWHRWRADVSVPASRW
jgi:hypothetical protein